VKRKREMDGVHYGSSCTLNVFCLSNKENVSYTIACGPNLRVQITIVESEGSIYDASNLYISCGIIVVKQSIIDRVNLGSRYVNIQV
jgi:hypothetical protein